MPGPRFVLSMDCDSEYFGEDDNLILRERIATLLQGVAEKIMHDDSVVIYDGNGNRVGEANIVIEPEVKPANWHEMFLSLIPKNGKWTGHSKIHAIKLWRFICNASLLDAKNYVEALGEGDIPLPTGNEHPDLPLDRMEHWNATTVYGPRFKLDPR